MSQLKCAYRHKQCTFCTCQHKDAQAILAQCGECSVQSTFRGLPEEPRPL